MVFFLKFFPNFLKIKILCIGSPITDHLKYGLDNKKLLTKEFSDDFFEELKILANLEGAHIIAFKDIAEKDEKLFDDLLKNKMAKISNMPVAFNPINFDSLDDYLSQLSYSTRKDLRRKLKLRVNLRIEEVSGIPQNIEEIYQLYLNTYEKSDFKFEKLTIDFFKQVPELMPNHSKYILYFKDDKLLCFNLLIFKDDVLYDKYIGLCSKSASEYDLYYLSWLYNIEFCIKHGFKIYQSGQSSDQIKSKLGSQFFNTFIYFKHRNQFVHWLLNKFSFLNISIYLLSTSSRRRLLISSIDNSI